jgi:hypothetical protein
MVPGTEPSHPPLTGPPVTSGPPAGDAAVGLPEVVSFEAPPEVACEGASAAVPVTYETRDATAVGLVVDQAASTAVEDPPLSGSQTLEVPCDGRAHTILLIAVGAEGGQSVATLAVRTGTGG